MDTRAALFKSSGPNLYGSDNDAVVTSDQTPAAPRPQICRVRPSCLSSVTSSSLASIRCRKEALLDIVNFDCGLERGTQRYDNCVTREVDARRYREQSQMSTPPVYTPAYTPAPALAPYVGSRTTGVATTRDEYGFRYDAEGNRLDRNDRIIS